jgi:hypothetical protein
LRLSASFRLIAFVPTKARLLVCELHIREVVRSFREKFLWRKINSKVWNVAGVANAGEMVFIIVGPVSATPIIRTKAGTLYDQILDFTPRKQSPGNTMPISIDIGDRNQKLS